MTEQCTDQPRMRPYFLPASIDYDSLPEPVKAAFDTIVLPAYQELVVAPSDALERAAGITIVFLLVEELFDQFDLGQQLDLMQSGQRGDQGSREKLINRHLRLVGAKQTAINALLRLRKLSLYPRVIPMGPPNF